MQQKARLITDPETTQWHQGRKLLELLHYTFRVERMRPDLRKDDTTHTRSRIYFSPENKMTIAAAASPSIEPAPWGEITPPVIRKPHCRSRQIQYFHLH